MSDTINIVEKQRMALTTSELGILEKLNYGDGEGGFLGGESDPDVHCSKVGVRSRITTVIRPLGVRN